MEFHRHAEHSFLPDVTDFRPFTSTDHIYSCRVQASVQSQWRMLAPFKGSGSHPCGDNDREIRKNWRQTAVMAHEPPEILREVDEFLRLYPYSKRSGDFAPRPIRNALPNAACVRLQPCLINANPVKPVCRLHSALAKLPIATRKKTSASP